MTDLDIDDSAMESHLPEAIEAGDSAAITAVSDSLPCSDALRFFLSLPEEERDRAFALITRHLATEAFCFPQDATVSTGLRRLVGGAFIDLREAKR